MPRLKKKYLPQQPAAAVLAPIKSTPYFRMRDGKTEVGVGYWTLYKLYQSGELRAASLTPEGPLYVRRADFDALWNQKLKAAAEKETMAA